jgi:DnaK suppressor protein
MSDEATIDASAYKARLESRRDELLRLAAASAEDRRPVELDQTRVGRLSRMDAMQSQAMSIETDRRRQAELGRIAAALRRIAKDEFGYCLSCGEAIAPKRLELDPANPLCVDCAQL